MPTKNGSALVLSTGRAADAFRPGALPEEFSSTELVNGPRGASGNDLTQVTLDFTPPSGAKCVALDVLFSSEEYPEYVGSQFNDVFTIETAESDIRYNPSDFSITAPNNQAFDSEGRLLSINTVYGIAPADESYGATTMNGLTEQLTASAPVEVDGQGQMRLILSIQDIGDNVFDSAALVDNFRYLFNDSCTSGATPVKDSDGDGLPDEWEINGIDGLDLPAMGADPYRKDLFVQADWMVRPAVPGGWFGFWAKPAVSFKPDTDAMRRVMRAFDEAPTPPVPQPAGAPPIKPGIALHIDSGPDSYLNGTTEAKWGALSRARKVDHTSLLGVDATPASIRQDFDDRAQLSDARSKVFRHALFADRLNDGGNSNTTGIALTSFDSSSYTGTKFVVSRGSDLIKTRQAEAGTFMHELGHVLGLRHGGGDHVEYKPNYASAMNYSFQLGGLRGPRKLDFSREVATMLDEQSLSERDGVTGTSQMTETYRYCPESSTGWVEIDPIDWNCNGSIEDGRVQADINSQDSITGGSLTELHGWDDWAHVRWDGYGIGGQGVGEPFELAPMSQELDLETAAELDILAAPGSTSASVVGPGTLLTGVPGQKLHVDVFNPSSEDATTEVTVEMPGLGFTTTLPVSVPAMVDGEPGRTRVVIDAPMSATAGPETGFVSTSGELGGVSEFEVEYLTLTDEQQAELLEYLESGNGPELDPQVRESVIDALDGDVPVDPVDPVDPEDPDTPSFGSLGSLTDMFGS
nr:choice-of-anchor L domain-containing protein [Dietzia sp. E1]